MINNFIRVPQRPQPLARQLRADNFVVVDNTDHTRVIAEADFTSAPSTLHEKAIYLLEGRLFQVERLDYDNRKAYVRAVDCDYYTDAIRYDVERMLARLTAEVPRFEATLSVVRCAGAMETDPDCEFVQGFCSAVDVDLTNAIGFTTDAPHLAPLGAPIVIYGPGKPNQCHQVDEHIAVADLEAGQACFKEVLLRFLT